MSFNHSLRMLIVDNTNPDQFIVPAIKHFPRISVVGYAGNVREASVIIDVMQPDILLMELMTLKDKGPELILKVKSEFPHSKIMVYADDINAVTQNLYANLGVDKFLNDIQCLQKLINSIEVLTGEKKEQPLA